MKTKNIYQVDFIHDIKEDGTASKTQNTHIAAEDVAIGIAQAMKVGRQKYVGEFRISRIEEIVLNVIIEV